jgi:hypothetical protein
MGVVYAARDDRLGRQVALKFVHPDFSREPRALERFRREARAASALNHPHICTVFDLDEHAGQPFLVLELVEGQSLAEVARRGCAPAEAARLGAQLAGALAAAHQAGVVHRDLKPGNVMVRPDGQAKLLDFGLARLLPAGSGLAGGPGGLTVPGELLGTILYMSPEQTRGEPAGPASDVFSLGVVLYELTAGRHPFPGDTAVAVMHAIQAREPPPPTRLRPELSAPLEGLLLAMLRKDPLLRPAADEAQRQLAALALAPARPAPARPAGPRTVGQARERAGLREAFAAAEAGRGLLLGLAGEPGAGKTTLVESFLEELAAGPERVVVARGQCSERLAGAEAYLPILEALDSLLEDGPSARALEAVAPAWHAQVAPGGSAGAADGSGASRERLKRELLAYFQELARERPVLLFLDDLHWADAPTVDLLAYLGMRCASLRLLMVTAYRPSALALGKHPFLEVKWELQGRGLCRELALSPLSRADVEDFLALELPGHAFPPELAALLHARTDGNPLFVVGLLRDLRDGGGIARVDGRWALVRPLAEVGRGLPESIRAMIRRKTERLGEEGLRLLTAASVQGHEFDAAVVARALGLEEARAEERLEEADRSHAFIRRVGERELPDGTLTLRYRFAHALYQNALFEALTPARKSSLSRGVAEALLACHGEQHSSVALELALLFNEARDFARASDHFLEAARRASSACANQEGQALARQALTAAEKLPGAARWPRVLAASLGLARLHFALARYEDELADYARVEEAARAGGDLDAEVGAVCGQALSLFHLRRFPEMREQGRRAREMACRAEARAPGAEGRLAKAGWSINLHLESAELLLASERKGVGDLAAAEEHYDRALPALKEKGRLLEAAEASAHRGLIHAWRLEYSEAERDLSWACEQALVLGRPFFAIQGLFGRGMVLGNQGRLGEALAALRQGMELAERHGEGFWLARLPNTLGWLYRELGDVETALRLDDESARVAREKERSETARTGLAGAANAQINLAYDCLALGELARALTHLDQARALYDRDVWMGWRYKIRLEAALAEHALARGDLPTARAHALASLQAAEKHLARKHVAWAHKLLGELAMQEGRMSDARSEFTTALQVLAERPCPTAEWKVLTSAAELARRLGDDSERDRLVGRSQGVVQALAGAVGEDRLREKFLGSVARASP